MAKKLTKRITGARALTVNEFVEMLREDDRKKKEEAELKQKRKEEREQKKKKEDQKKQKAEEQARKKQERQNRKQKLSKEKTQRNTRRRVNLDSCSESDDILAAVNDVVVALDHQIWMGSKIVQTQVLFALDARDSYLLVFVRTVTMMRTTVFYVLFVSQTSLMVCLEKLSSGWIVTSAESGFITIVHLVRTM